MLFSLVMERAMNKDEVKGSAKRAKDKQKIGKAADW